VSACAGNTSVNTVGGEDAGVIPCGAYLCLEDAGTCTTSCKSASDCAPGGICNAQGECGTSTKSSCSCGVVGGNGGGGGAYGLAIAVGLLLARRRRG
jgi:MYXO-CTERM domain-containing protein